MGEKGRLRKVVFFTDLNKLNDVLNIYNIESFSGKKIPIKLHLGEKNNKYFLKPDLAKLIVDELKKVNADPFLFDTTVAYSGMRSKKHSYLKLAKIHGFTEKEVGCPIVISNIGVDVKTRDMTVHVCKELIEADGILVVSHVKGHCCYGFGGAIKNLGMGGVTPESKKEIHSAGQAETDDLLAQSAQAVLSGLKKVFYINFLIDIAKNCDCANDAGPIVAEDIGILFGQDIVAIDKASVDLIYQQKPKVFDKLHDHDPYLQIKYAKELGLGEEEYDIS